MLDSMITLLLPIVAGAAMVWILMKWEEWGTAKGLLAVGVWAVVSVVVALS